MVILKEVKAKDRELLWNINQKYLYEMTLYYSDDMDENGNYQYGYFDAYFTESERKAYFIFEGENIVGFVMINTYSYLGHEPDNVIAEFTIFPSYRHRGIATKAAYLILNKFPGKWEIKFNEKNIGAKKLWESIAEQYSPNIYHLNEDETVLEFVN